MASSVKDAIDTLLKSDEPCIRYKVRTGVVGEDPESRAIKRLRNEIRRSERVQKLLSERDAEGRIPCHPYVKWYGAHWVLATLADLGYPPGDKSLIPLREQVLSWLLSDKHTQSVPIIEGRARRCGSQEGNALFALLTLGLADERADQLAANLMKWQWPDGGWNCDRKPTADTSSYHETWIPVRALSLYGEASGDKKALASAKRAAELLLRRRLYRRLRDGAVIDERWLALCYPHYWWFDILSGLRAIVEAGRIKDPRCADALDLLESKRLPNGGFPAEGKHYRVTNKKTATGCHASLVDWGGASRRKMNEFVTADALYVLSAASRLEAR
jgi:hypothetical protein